MTDQPPPNPFGSTPLGDSAHQLHEMFRAYLAAGFTEEQALRLLALLAAYTVHVQQNGIR